MLLLKGGLLVLDRRCHSVIVATCLKGHKLSLHPVWRQLVLLHLELLLLLLLVLLHLVLGLLEGISYGLLRLTERMLDLLCFQLVAVLMPTCQRYIIFMIAVLRCIMLNKLRIDVANLFLGFVRVSHLFLHFVTWLVELPRVDSLAFKEAQWLCFTLAFVEGFWVEALWNGCQVPER